MSEIFTNKQCTAFCLAKRFDINALAKTVADSQVIRLVRGTLMIEGNQNWSVIFAYGAVVHWNISEQQQTKLQSLLLEFAEDPLPFPEHDSFSFALSCPTTRINQDHIEIESSDAMAIFSISHAMAQSIKLASFETNAVTTINNTNYIPESLAKKGRITLKSISIAKTRGQLFLTKHDIILNYDLLDTPDFFWEYPEYENYYNAAAKYLEISQRTQVLSRKLETIHELFEMLADEQKYRHSTSLEWIVICLIAIEIVMTVVDKLF